MYELTNDKKWIRQKVEYILKNPKYIGLQRWGLRANHDDNIDKDPILAKLENIEPIISQATWDRCYFLMHKKSQKEIDPKFYETPYLVRDLIYCGHCNNKLKVVNQETNSGRSGSRLYLCTNRSCKKVRLVS
ncbi:recombinase family protein [Desulfuribacillus stibiiarsenatis]|uniref:recombinase family protein n=1 Tax=Desulfuribacillus stibiiarsenatis TaxID=1390249 RepID=UPI0009F56DCD